MTKFVPPVLNQSSFTCPHCGVLAGQAWDNLFHAHTRRGRTIPGGINSICHDCGLRCFWYGDQLKWPDFGNTQQPNEDMPGDVKEDYEEARSIVSRSSKGAAALLRLAIQRLMPHLGEAGKHLDTDIGNLAKKGLPPHIIKALDVVRVIGNESVHPGTIDINDDPATANMLFELVNEIVNVLISQPKRIDELHQKLPQTKLDAIKKRDGAPPTP